MLFMGGAASLEPSPIAGELDITLTMASPDGDGARDGVAMVGRLAALRVDAVLDEAGPGRIVLRTTDVRSAADVAFVVLPPRRLSFHIVDDVAPYFTPAAMASPTGAEQVTDAGRSVIGGPAPLVAELIAQAALPPDRIARMACGDAAPGMRPTCFAQVLEVPALVTGEHVAEAEAVADPNSWGAQVMLTFDDEGARLFGLGTAANIQRRLAIVVDDEVLSAPVIQTAIPGGRAQLTMGNHEDAQAELLEAQLLAAALGGGHSLTATWEVTDERVTP